MTGFEHDISALLGRSVDDAEVQTFFAKLDDRVKVTSDEGELFWVAYGVGMEVLAVLPSRRITTVLTYAEKTQSPEQKQYSGKLPHGLDFAMSREQVKTQMGSAPWKSGRGHDAWDFGRYYLTVTYSKAGNVHTIAVSGHS